VTHSLSLVLYYVCYDPVVEGTDCGIVQESRPAVSEGARQF
jgi:hypothetical protein